MNDEMIKRDHLDMITLLQRNLAIVLSSTSNLDQALESIWDAAAQSTGLDSGGIYLLDETTDGLSLLFYKNLSPQFVQQVSYYDANAFQSLLVKKRQSVFLKFAELSEPLKQTCQKENLRVIGIVPICQGDQVIGCLNMASRTDGEITIATRNIVEAIASQVGSAILRIKTEKTLHQTLENLREKEQRLISQERLRALGEMAAGIAHDFNNALQPIFIAASILEKDPLTNKEEAKAYIRDILVAAQEASLTVQRLVSFYRTEGIVKPSCVNLASLIREVVELTRGKWKEVSQANNQMIQIITELSEEWTVGNEHELKEVFFNLMINAIESIVKNGLIKLSTDSDDKWAIVEICDNGVGMSKEVLGKCIEPFFSTKRHKGSGLGLSIAYGVVKRHNGEIEIKSDIGKGTSVIVKLPKYLRETPVTVATSQPKKTLPPIGLKSAYKILVVDDEPSVLDFLHRAVSRLGYSVTGAFSGTDAWEKFVANHFDLVMTDQAMSGMTGEQLAFKIKQAKPNLPIIMLTGFGSIMKAENNVSSCIDLLLTKPIMIKELDAAISGILMRDER